MFWGRSGIVSSVSYVAAKSKPRHSSLTASLVLILVVAAQCCCSSWSWAGHPSCEKFLSRKLDRLIASHEGDVAVMIKHLPSGHTYAHRATEPMPTASLIKFPVLIATHQRVAAGQLDLSKVVTLTKADMMPGSGVLTQHFSPGCQFPLRDAVRLMIAVSDNSATNLVLDQIGLQTTNQLMAELECPNTRLHAKVFQGKTSWDPEGSRTYGLGRTTAAEMISLLERLQNDQLVSPEACAAMRRDLSACSDKKWVTELLPDGTGALLKTGAVSNARTAAGILETPAGPIALCILTNRNTDQRWSDENSAIMLMNEVSRVAYHVFNPTAATAGDFDGTLKLGDKGEYVTALQRTLNERMKPERPLRLDGEFGPQTQQAIREFQKQQGLRETGVVDASVWPRLNPLLLDEHAPLEPAVVNQRQWPLAADDLDEKRPYVSCRTWAIGDPQTGRLLADHQGSRRVDIASTTKMMTAYVVISELEKQPDLVNQRLTFSTEADATPGSTANLRTGEQVALLDALYGLMLPSGNDMSIALAEYFGSRAESEDAAIAPVEAFVAKMNEAAEQLGMHQTHFANPHGLTSPQHYSSAGDLFLLANAALTKPLFRQIVSRLEYACPIYGPGGYVRYAHWKNTNQLLSMQGHYGIKTGTTMAAGACLISRSERKGRELIVVVLGSSCSEARYIDTLNLQQWAWRELATDSQD